MSLNWQKIDTFELNMRGVYCDSFTHSENLRDRFSAFTCIPNVTCSTL